MQRKVLGWGEKTGGEDWHANGPHILWPRFWLCWHLLFLSPREALCENEKEMITGVPSRSDGLPTFALTILVEKILKLAHAVRPWIFRTPPLGKWQVWKKQPRKRESASSKTVFPTEHSLGLLGRVKHLPASREESFYGQIRPEITGLSKVKCFVVFPPCPPPPNLPHFSEFSSCWWPWRIPKPGWESHMQGKCTQREMNAKRRITGLSWQLVKPGKASESFKQAWL